MESKPPISVKTISPHKTICRIIGIPSGSHTPIFFFIMFLPDIFQHSHRRIYMQKIQMHMLPLSDNFLQFEKNVKTVNKSFSLIPGAAIRYLSTFKFPNQCIKFVLRRFKCSHQITRFLIKFFQPTIIIHFVRLIYDKRLDIVF